jgi:hypothetical protein
MKKLFVFALAIVLLSACGGKPTAKEQVVVKKGPFAKIEWLTDTLHDFGLYKEREAKSFDFVYRNVGKIPFAIDSVKTSCGCTSANYVKRAVLPGQTDTIHVIYGGNGFSPGFFYQTVVAYANTENYIILKIKGIFDHVE